MGYISSIICS
jgi:hypothetical protein